VAGFVSAYAPLQHLLFADGRLRALVMTSANLSEEPIAIDNEERGAGWRDCGALVYADARSCSGAMTR